MPYFLLTKTVHSMIYALIKYHLYNTTSRLKFRSYMLGNAHMICVHG